MLHHFTQSRLKLAKKKKKTDQWNRIKNPEINPNIYIQLIFDKGAKNLNVEKLAFSINGVGENGKSCKI